MKILIAFLLLASVAHGAQSITIPQGTTIYGPVSVNMLHRRTALDFRRTNTNFTRLKVIFEYSESGSGGPWLRLSNGAPYCALEAAGLPLVEDIQIDCPFPKDSKPTHVRAIAEAIGGSVTLVALPNLRSK